MLFVPAWKSTITTPDGFSVRFADVAARLGSLHGEQHAVSILANAQQAASGPSPGSSLDHVPDPVVPDYIGEQAIVVGSCSRSFRMRVFLLVTWMHSTFVHFG
jgi:hypothetical protein